MKLTFLIGSVFLSLSLLAQVTPESDGSIYSLNFNSVELKVDASTGAKVRSLIVNGNEFLSQNEATSFSWGATLWAAPQTEWGWPPPFMKIEDGEYTATIEDDVMTFVSADDYGMQFTKSFWANSSDTSIHIEYVMEKTGTEARTNALWELVRPGVNGLTFWPTGPKGAWGALSSSVVEEGSYSWLDVDAEKRRSLKFFADGTQGWMAHVDANRTLFIKKFDDVDESDFADGEGEIELWIADDYIELETLTAAKNLEPGDKLTYNMIWYVRELPESISVEVGSSSLLAYVNNLLDVEGVGVESIPNVQYSVYPNPAVSQVSFSWQGVANSNAQLQVFNAIGSQVLSAQVQKDGKINISELNNGIYIYTLNLNDKAYHGKFIKR